MQAAFDPKERGALQLVWGQDEDWRTYLCTFLEAIRAKHFPGTQPLSRF